MQYNAVGITVAAGSIDPHNNTMIEMLTLQLGQLRYIYQFTPLGCRGAALYVISII